MIFMNLVKMNWTCVLFGISLILFFDVIGISGEQQGQVDFSQLEFEDLETQENRDAFVANLESYEVTYPQALEKDYKLTENHRRLRRDLSDKRISHYQINAFGKIIQLELQNSDSILPGASIEYHTDNGVETKLLSDNGCFKIGKVSNSNASSSAAISDCDGLAGLVKTADDLFFIEPMKSNSSDNSSTSRPHLLYRTKDLPKNAFADYGGRRSLEEPLQAAQAPRVDSPANGRSRARRDIWDSFITVVNKAQRSVQLHWLDVYGDKKYFVTLGPNQKRAINTYSRTKWVALDESTKQNLHLNGQKYYLTQVNDESRRIEVVVEVPNGVVLEPVTSNDVIGDDKWIEALIVADESVVRFHGKAKVEKYLLILSNMISLIMKDKTIGVRLNFVLTRLVILQRKEPKLTIHRKNPSKSVQSACDYAASIQKSVDDAHSEHHDFSLILTRHNFGPAGYAPVYTMCTRTRSCALVDDSGFSAAFIGAHEAGHTLGLGHDGDENECREDAAKGSVMAPLVLSKLSQFHWSPCSRKVMQENIGYFRCLKDRPYPKDFKYMNSLPGVFATMDEQCRFSFGPGYERCDYYTTDRCQHLWCTESKSRYQSCTTKRRPPLDGTYCGKDKWCQKGRCVASNIASTEPTPVDGKWSNWSRWSKCSQSCGTGLRYRSRKCDSPKPAHRGKACEGSATDRDVCNLQRCRITKNFDDVRNDQCKLLAGKGWRLYTDSVFREIFQTKRFTLDCTFQRNYCNWRQDTNDKFNWKTTAGRTPSADTGPRNDPSGNVNGRYAFIEASDNFGARRRHNDNARLISPTLVVPRACLRLNYHMYGRHMGSLKVILQAGRDETVLWQKSGNQGNQWHLAEVSIESSVQYHIVVEAVRGAHYTSDVSIDNFKFETGLCPKEAAEQNPCAITCMTENKRKFILDKVVVDGTRCHNNKSHNICQSGTCVKFGCDGKFGSNKTLDECFTCGGDGSTCDAVEGTKNIVPNRVYEKILELDKDTTNFVLEDSKSSPYRIGVRIPGSISETYIAAEKGHGYYEVGGSTIFYANLDDGRQLIASSGPFKQPVEAVLYVGSNEIRQDKEKAQLRFKYFEKKVDKSLFKYEFKEWGKCSKSCNAGVQTAIMKCVRDSRKEVSSRYCSHLTFNERTRACNLMPCQHMYEWILMPWTRCSASCGTGRQRRIIACSFKSVRRVAPNRKCPRPFPKNVRSCNTHPCVTYGWTFSAWGKCSRSCGGGLQIRIVNCVGSNSNKVVNARYCKNKEPPRVRECNLHQCDTFEFRTHAVSKCSKSCGGGLRVKIVYCFNKRTGGRVGNQFCSGPPPRRIEKCNTTPCPVYEWVTGKFGRCSTSCDSGTKQRDVYCAEKISDKKVDQRLCKGRKPKEAAPCENQPCSRYMYEANKWSGCDALCGNGMQNRTISCLMEGTRAVSPNWRCNVAKKPTTSRPCQAGRCSNPDTLACNFDAGHTCNWDNARSDDFDWVVGRSTPTLTTGPARDHTTRRGKFAYIETSSPRISGDRAALTSPIIRVNRGCFSFWYHMRGTGMGRLTVMMVGANNYEKELFRRERHQGDRWSRANIAIPKNTPKGYKLLIFGIKGSSFLSDIGLDDFSYSEKDCPAACIERSPLCGVVPIEYCQYSAFMKLCCETCSKRT